jgi:hypothetical protein
MSARPMRRGWPTPESKRTSQMSSRRLGALWSQAVDADEPDHAEEIDSLLLSSLRFWEVEHDLIEERMEALRSVSDPRLGENPPRCSRVSITLPAAS